MFRLLGNFVEAAKDLRLACKIDFDEQADEWLKEVTPNVSKKKILFKLPKNDMRINPCLCTFSFFLGACGGRKLGLPSPWNDALLFS